MQCIPRPIALFFCKKEPNGYPTLPKGETMMKKKLLFFLMLCLIGVPLLIGNHTVVVSLPRSEYYDILGYPLFEKVTEYFDFELVTYFPAAETDAVQ
jgi:hypothetical protein